MIHHRNNKYCCEFGQDCIEKKGNNNYQGKYYSPYELHARGGGNFHYQHKYDYKNVNQNGEYMPYNRHREERNFERARVERPENPSNEVNFKHLRNPEKKYFKFDDRKAKNDKDEEPSYQQQKNEQREYEPIIKKGDKKIERIDEEYLNNKIIAKEC